MLVYGMMAIYGRLKSGILKLMAIIKKATYSGQQTTDALSGKLTFEQGQGRIVGRDENNLPQLVISTNPFEMKVAKAGFDVLTAPNEDLIFNSSQNIFKIVDSNSITFNKPAANWLGTGIYTHNLGYVPAVIAFVQNSGTLTQIPLHTPVQIGYGADNGKIALSIYPDLITSTNITFRCFTPSMSGPFGNINYDQSIDITIKFYLLQESAN